MRIPFRKVIRHWPTAIDAAAMALDPLRSVSYYPEVPRKTRVRTVVENITWAIRHGEVNGNYFAYGLDRVGVRPADYLGHRQAMSLIAARNRNVSGDPSAGGRTGMLRDKRAFAEVASRLGYPVPRIVGIIQKHRIALIDPPRTIAVQDLGSQEGLVAFAKPVDGHHGQGAFLLAVRLGRVHLDDKPTAGHDLAARLSGPMLLQEPIVQHEATAVLHPSSVNTIRLITVLAGDRCWPFVAAIRIGTGGARVDNWATGGIAVRVDLEASMLTGRGFFRGGKKRWSVTRHPDTGVLLDGHRLPGLADATSMACAFHREIGGLHTIGWDLALTGGGPMIVEANAHWGEGIHLTVESGFGRRLLDLDTG